MQKPFRKKSNLRVFLNNPPMKKKYCLLCGFVVVLFFEAVAVEGSRDPCVFAVLRPNDGRLSVTQSTVPMEIVLFTSQTETSNLIQFERCYLCVSFMPDGNFRWEISFLPLSTNMTIKLKILKNLKHVSPHNIE